MTLQPRESEAVVIGASAGGLRAVSAVLETLPPHFPAVVAVVQHRSASPNDRLSSILRQRCALPVRQAEDKEPLEGGCVFVAPAGYHLLVEEDRTFSLSVDQRVRYARPSVDVLFETAAEAYYDTLVGVVLTGAGQDGAAGLRRIAMLGGVTIVQDPETAEVPSMPAAALQSVPESLRVALHEIGSVLDELCVTPTAPDSRIRSGHDSDG